MTNLDGTQREFTWVITASLLVITVSTPIWGKSSDLVSMTLLVHVSEEATPATWALPPYPRPLLGRLITDGHWHCRTRNNRSLLVLYLGCQLHGAAIGVTALGAVLTSQVASQIQHDSKQLDGNSAGLKNSYEDNPS